MVGCLVDIFSAIVVLAPLVVPMATAFGVHPVHLGVIFLANLELGYLTPPVGLNLFLAASRFGKPLTTVVRTVLPFLLILAVSVLLITYLPALSVGCSSSSAGVSRRTSEQRGQVSIYNSRALRGYPLRHPPDRHWRLTMRRALALAALSVFSHRPCSRRTSP